jgi:hypothetical protein
MDMGGLTAAGLEQRAQKLMHIFAPDALFSVCRSTLHQALLFEPVAWLIRAHFRALVHDIFHANSSQILFKIRPIINR